MIGDVHATSAGGSVPLPPAFSHPPVPRPDAEDQRLQPPYYGSGPAPTISEPVAPAEAAATPIAFTALEPVAAEETSAETPGYAGFGGLPSDAVFLPEAPIPRKAVEEEEVDNGLLELADSRRRPVPASDLAVLVAARLELMARRLRERGSGGLVESFSGDALDLALAGLISGYMAGRGG